MQNRMIDEYFPRHFTKRPAWEPRPLRGNGVHAGSPSEVTRKVYNYRKTSSISRTKS